VRVKELSPEIRFVDLVLTPDPKSPSSADVEAQKSLGLTEAFWVDN